MGSNGAGARARVPEDDPMKTRESRDGAGRMLPQHARSLHRGRPIRTKPIDSYASGAKPSDSMVCETCGVVWHGGRWYWGAPPESVVRAGLCPACQRISDRYPAGQLVLDASLVPRLAEIEHIVRKVEVAERQEHPLERVMALEASAGGIEVTTTGVHMARRIAGRLGRTLHTRPKVTYLDDPTSVRIEFGPRS
jgi:hypothetical protein